jgi:hypothetical protein
MHSLKSVPARKLNPPAKPKAISAPAKAPPKLTTKAAAPAKGGDDDWETF